MRVPWPTVVAAVRSVAAYLIVSVYVAVTAPVGMLIALIVRHPGVLYPGFLTTPRRSCLRRRVWGSGRPDGAAAMVWTRAMSCARRQNRPGKHTGPERTPVPPAVVNVCRRLADRQARSGGERKR